MSLTNTPSSERTHIAFFGCRNAGKSSLVNAVTGQELAVVSEIKGTTTDPVKKAMEILPLGPIVIIDTAGIDDEGELGNLRIEKTNQVLNKTDIAVLVTDCTRELNDYENKLINVFKERKLPYVIACNKSDLLSSTPKQEDNKIYVSAKTGKNIYELKELLGRFLKENTQEKFIIFDKLNKSDTVILVIPIDESAPKGRLILPQQLVLRELLDNHCTAVCCQVEELENTIKSLAKVNLVITDSQAFKEVSKIVPENIKLTSFSILMARYKGELEELVKGARTIPELKDGDKVLISEGCTHHRQCNDIGTVKLPKLLEKTTGTKLDYSFTSGGEFPEDLSEYKLIIHCGACMLNETEMKNRILKCKNSSKPIVNYGIALAYMNGILEKSLEILEI